MHRAIEHVGPAKFEELVMRHLQTFGKELEGEVLAHEIERVARGVVKPIKKYQAILRWSLKVSKGDVEGHEFHGNQYVGSLGAKGTFNDLVTRLSQPDGGFTYSVVTGKEPKGGYVLSIHPDRSAVFDKTALSKRDLVHYIVKNRDLLRQTGNHLGGWHDPASGKVFLDVSRITHDQKEAERLAREHDQIAYFDLNNFTSVTVNPDATSGGTVNHDDRKKKAASDADCG